MKHLLATLTVSMFALGFVAGFPLSSKVIESLGIPDSFFDPIDLFPRQIRFAFGVAVLFASAPIATAFVGRASAPFRPLFAYFVLGIVISAAVAWYIHATFADDISREGPLDFSVLPLLHIPLSGTLIVMLIAFLHREIVNCRPSSRTVERRPEPRYEY